MSYDLYFEAGRGKALDRKSFFAYFTGRRHCERQKGQVLYQNQDTGVYFLLDEPEDGKVALSLNLYRPHTFGLEAAPEIEAFASHFAATVVDPQQDAPPGPFNREAFIKSWNESNRFAYASMMQDNPNPTTWPTKKIREVWDWNHSRPTEEEQDAATVFVPTIFAINSKSGPQSIAIWPPGCPILMPAVDAVMVPLSQDDDAGEEMALVPWAELGPIVEHYKEAAPGLPRYRLEFLDWPAEIEAFLNRKRSAATKIDGVGMDEILDREMVDAARKGG